jgi:HD-GYP domain-containing protein (c-di-GMP phosphodiesterase class II)
VDACPVSKVAHFKEKECKDFLKKFCSNCLEEPTERFPKQFFCHLGQRCTAFAVEHANQKKGFVVLCSVARKLKETDMLTLAFKNFIQSETNAIFKGYELDNFYETIHPRALALSTIHSVHRALSTSMHLDELLPRISRLCAQVIQAGYCAIYLVEERHKFLISKFVLGAKPSKKEARITIGKGPLGKIAETGEVVMNRNCLAVPLIEEDIMGIVVLKNKYDHTSFKRIDVEILRTLAEQAVIAIRNAQLYEERENLTLGSIESINMILKHKVPRANQYSPLFFTLTLEVAKRLGLQGEDLSNLHRAISLLNVGRAGIPLQILQKKGKLTKAEKKVLRQQPIMGANIVRSISSLKPIVPIILHHRERFDGQGYPSGLKGEEIPIGARIVAVTDAFSAMMSHRPYRSAMTIKDAMHEIKKHSGSQFDPKVVESFLEVIQNDPEFANLSKGNIYRE